jgi:hypothetical protein
MKLVYLDGYKAVLYRSRMNPSPGRNFEALDPLEWLPQPRRGARQRDEAELQEASGEPRLRSAEGR